MAACTNREIGRRHYPKCVEGTGLSFYTFSMGDLKHLGYLKKPTSILIRNAYEV